MTASPVAAEAPVYLDDNATTPVDPRVVEAMLPFLSHAFGNPLQQPRLRPAGAHCARARPITGRRADRRPPGRDRVHRQRLQADALAVRGSVLAVLEADPARWSGRRPRVITQTTEHPAVLHAARYLQRWHGVDLVELPVDGHGRIRPEELAAALSDSTVLVSVMHSNNETGTVQDVSQLASLSHRAGALFHTDAAQTVGKIAVDVVDLGVDLLTLVGHKMYSPKGIAALYVRDGVRLEPVVGGGGQERGLRAGTENVALAVALGAAADLAAADLAAGEPDRLRKLRDSLHAGLSASLPGRVHLNGDAEHRLPHTLNISIDGTSGDTILAAAPGLAASTGSACHSGHTDPSPVLTAMGVPRDLALAALRLSLGRWTTTDHIAAALTALTDAVALSPSCGTGTAR